MNAPQNRELAARWRDQIARCYRAQAALGGVAPSGSVSYAIGHAILFRSMQLPCWVFASRWPGSNPISQVSGHNKRSGPPLHSS